MPAAGPSFTQPRLLEESRPLAPTSSSLPLDLTMPHLPTHLTLFHPENLPSTTALNLRRQCAMLGSIACASLFICICTGGRKEEREFRYFPTDSDHSMVQHMNESNQTAARASLDNRRRYHEKIFHFPCGVEPVAGALMQVILEKDSRASFPFVSPASQTHHFYFGHLLETCLRTRGTHALHHLASPLLHYHLKDPDPRERMIPILTLPFLTLTQTSLAASPRRISPSLWTQYSTNELAQSAHPKRDDPLHLRRYSVTSSSSGKLSCRYALHSLIRFDFPALDGILEDSEDHPISKPITSQRPRRCTLI
jgi:hypothetical protein